MKEIIIIDNARSGIKPDLTRKCNYKLASDVGLFTEFVIDCLDDIGLLHLILDNRLVVTEGEAPVISNVAVIDIVAICINEIKAFVLEILQSVLINFHNIAFFHAFIVALFEHLEPNFIDTSAIAGFFVILALEFDLWHLVCFFVGLEVFPLGEVEPLGHNVLRKLQQRLIIVGHRRIVELTGISNLVFRVGQLFH